MTTNQVNDDQGTISGIGESSSSANRPGKRPKNPLSEFASYTYQLSLYMITPQAYDAFVASGRTQINSLTDADGKPLGGTYLIAQSGGINTSTDFRASTNELNYYIDNLSIKTFLSGKATLTASVDTEIRFQITEPYGFSFLTDLRRVADIIYGPDISITRPQNPTRQFFVLGVKFIGYDQNGKVVTTENAQDQTASDSDLFRIQTRYFDILVTDVKFKLTGSAVVYDFSAVALAPRIGFGITKGRITSTITVEGGTVEDAINEIVSAMNEEQAALASATGLKTNTYNVIWTGEGVDKLKASSILSPVEIEYARKATTPMNSAENTQESTEGVATESPDLNSRTVQIKNDTAVADAVTQVISQSSYLTDAFNVITASTLEPVIQPQSTEENKKISWYTLGTRVRNATWVPEISDFVYEIDYIIQPYETPAITTPYGITEDTYYGPYKRYDYWYTGQNTEVLSYEQNINNGYFTIYLDVTDTARENMPEVTMASNMRFDQSRLGAIGIGKEIQNSALTSLYDPASFATAQLTILGDPDYLMPDSPDSEAQINDKFYAADGFTINPHAGQTFIEIDFKEARDYDLEKGYMKINDRILFWKYPDESQDQGSKIKGISYMIIDVNSTFRGGVFKQVLNCIVNPLSLVSKKFNNPNRTAVNARPLLTPLVDGTRGRIPLTDFGAPSINASPEIINEVLDYTSGLLGPNTPEN